MNNLILLAGWWSQQVTTDDIDSGGGKMSSFDWRVILQKHMEDSQTIGRITRTSTTIDRTLGPQIFEEVFI